MYDEKIKAQILCMKWGPLYSAEYVNKLYGMVKRNISSPFRFVCLTDNSEDIDSEVECYPCPEIELPEQVRNKGWRKLTTYAPSTYLYDLKGVWLFLDLDVVITGSLDPFFSYEPNKDFVVMRNWSQPKKNIGNTSVYRFHIGKLTYILDQLLENQTELLKTYSNSQTYISRTVKEIVYWPDSWCILFKVQCIPAWPQRFWKAPVLPQHTRVVAFPGNPNPHEAEVGNWPVKRKIKRLYKYIRPTNWIREYWN
jgi:hypothetical protein